MAAAAATTASQAYPGVALGLAPILHADAGGLTRIDCMLYSNSISRLAAYSGERSALVGSGGVNTASRSMAVR